MARHVAALVEDWDLGHILSRQRLQRVRAELRRGRRKMRPQGAAVGHGGGCCLLMVVGEVGGVMLGGKSQ